MGGWANKPISMPTQWAWVKASGSSPKPSPNDALNPGDPGIPTPFSLHHYHLTSAIRISSHGQQNTRMQLNNGKQPGVTQGHHTRNEAIHYKNAKTEARGNKTNGLPNPHCLCPHQIVGLRVTEVQCWLPPQCHWGLIDLEVPGIHTTADYTTGSLEVTWRSTCQSSKMRTQKMPSPTKVGAGI